MTSTGKLRAVALHHLFHLPYLDLYVPLNTTTTK